MNENIAQILARGKAAQHSYLVMEDRIEVLLQMCQPIFQTAHGAGEVACGAGEVACEDRPARMVGLMMRVLAQLADEVKRTAKVDLMGRIADRALHFDSEARSLAARSSSIKYEESIDMLMHETLMWLYNDLIISRVLKPDSAAELKTRQASDDIIFIGAFSKKQPFRSHDGDSQSEAARRSYYEDRGRRVLLVLEKLERTMHEAFIDFELCLYDIDNNGLSLALVPSAALGIVKNAAGKLCRALNETERGRVLDPTLVDNLHNIYICAPLGAQFDTMGRCVGTRAELRPVHWLYEQRFTEERVNAQTLAQFPLLKDFNWDLSGQTWPRYDIAFALRPHDISSEYGIAIWQVLHKPSAHKPSAHEPSAKRSRVFLSRNLELVKQWQGPRALIEKTEEVSESGQQQ